MTAPQELIANRYRLGSLIAGGGMGQVWRGRDTLLDRPVAVKVLRDQFAADPAFRARFRSEAQHAATLVHPHIAAVFDYGELPATPARPPLAYLVMELVEGESLADVLRREGSLDVPRTLDVLRQAADGLGAAHAAGVVHRDIKPANLLVGLDGRVKLTDFGIARSTGGVAVTATGQVMGTAHYLSPEQASGRPAGPASDVYALGTVGYECLAGRRAFEGESAVQIAVMQIREHPDPLPAGIPPAVRALVERAMAKDPAARFADGSALRDAVDVVRAGGSATPAPRTTALSRTAVLPRTVAPPATAVLPVVPGPGPAPAAAPVPRRRRRRWPVAVLLTALLLAVGGAVVATALRDGATSTAAPVSEEPTPSETTAAVPSAPAGVDVVAADLLGRPVGEVQAELVARGLRVELRAVETGDVASGRVIAVAPAGTLPPDALVRLDHAVPPVPAPPPAPDPAPVDEGDQGDGDEGTGNGNGDGADEERPGNGNGNGNGREGRDRDRDRDDD
ncbi:serine/threonine protein kinase [Blastococcus fimeti]|nr:serine/threonine protein kinase [Blastococcus fimeti]